MRRDVEDAVRAEQEEYLESLQDSDSDQQDLCTCSEDACIKVPIMLTIPEASDRLNTWPREFSIEEFESILQHMISAGFDINDTGLLFNAFMNTDREAISVLFKNGAKINNGEKLYKTQNPYDGELMSIFHDAASVNCEELLLDHILSEPEESQDIIFGAIKRKPYRLDLFSNVANTGAFAEKFAKLCVLAGTFPVSRPSYDVMRLCHKEGMTHPDYITVKEKLNLIKGDRDHWKQQFTSVSDRLERMEAIISTLNIQ